MTLNEIYITVECHAGAHISNVARDMWDLSERLHVDVVIRFNGVELFTGGKSGPDSIVTEYHQRLKDLNP